MRSLLLSIFLFALPAVGLAQDVGDSMVVVAADAPLRSLSEITGTVPQGQILTVKEVNGDWLWVIHSDATGTRKGWLARRHCVPVNEAYDIFDAQLTQYPTADAYRHRGSILQKRGDVDLALEDFDQAVRLAPDRADAYHDRAAAWLQKFAYEKAIADCDEALRINPSHVLAHITRGLAAHGQGDHDKALADLSEALQLDPDNPLAYQHRAFVLTRQGNADQALADLDEAIRRDPQDPSAYFNRGSVWGHKGELDKAIADFGRAIRVNPKYAAAYCNRGTARKMTHDYAKARGDYEKAVEIDPNYSLAHDALAWLLATCPDAAVRDGARAIDHATTACELTRWKQAASIETLAAAYAEAGDFEQAVQRQQQAVDMAGEMDKKAYLSRLSSYQAGQPYRDAPRMPAE